MNFRNKGTKLASLELQSESIVVIPERAVVEQEIESSKHSSEDGVQLDLEESEAESDGTADYSTCAGDLTAIKDRVKAFDEEEEHNIALPAEFDEEEGHHIALPVEQLIDHIGPDLKGPQKIYQMCRRYHNQT